MQPFLLGKFFLLDSHQDTKEKIMPGKHMHICFASDNNYVPYMGIAVLSILQHAQTDEYFHFYILDNKISQNKKQTIERILKGENAKISWLPIDEIFFQGCKTQRKNWTFSIFSRYLIPQLINQDKVLYLDCDVMVRTSLWPLWQTDLTDYYLAGVPDYNVIHRGRLLERFHGELDPQKYVNSGVLLINNKKWRQENLLRQLLEYSVENADSLIWPDQDAINYICRNGKKMLSSSWNVMGYVYKKDLFINLPQYMDIVKESQNVYIRHFHPWKKNFFIPHREEYLQIMRQSPWKDLMPKDDPKPLAWAKMVTRYLWRHPFCFLLPKFYKRWYYRGTACLFLDY